jgi:hypothetical protein
MGVTTYILPRGTLYPQKLAITSPTSGGRLVGIVLSRTQTMEFVCLLDAFYFRPMLGGVPVPAAWRILGLRMEERPPAMEISCEYIE